MIESVYSTQAEYNRYYDIQKDTIIHLKNRDIYDLGNYAKYFQYPFLHDFTASEFIRKLREIPYQSFIQNQNRMLDDLSYSIYGTENLWWILGFYNNIIDPINTEVEKIFIPNTDKLESLILSHFEGKPKESQ